MHDNYINENDGRRSPKSLSALCVDAVCRSFPNLDGELPAGLPQDVVDDIVGSLVKHAALNATTLRVLKNCELGKLVLCGKLERMKSKEVGKKLFLLSSCLPSLSLASASTVLSLSVTLLGCRGVTDEWLEPFATRNSISSSEQPCHEGMDVDVDYSKNSHHEYVYGTSGHPAAQGHEEAVAESCNSSRSTSSFVSANSILDPDIEHSLNIEATSFAAMAAAGGPPIEDVMMEDDHPGMGYDGMPAAFSSPTATLTELDLRGSQRLTDKGLLQLQDLCQLEVARLDNCHTIVGRGLLALSVSHRLHTLSLSGCRRLTDEAIINISHMVTLESLNLEGCRCLTDRSLAALAGLFGLRKLDISQCDLVTDAGLEHLEGLEVLEELSVGWCRSITDRGLDTLTLQPGRSELLRILRLARCMITDSGVEYFGRLLALEELDLNGCSNISSLELGRALERMPSLQTLDVSYCPGIL